MKIRLFLVVTIFPFVTLSAQIGMDSTSRYVKDNVLKSMILRESSSEELQDYFAEKISIDSMQDIKDEMFDIFTHYDVNNLSVFMKSSLFTSTKKDPKVKYVKTLVFKTEPRVVICKPNITIKLNRKAQITALDLYNHYTNQNLHQYDFDKIFTNNDSINLAVRLGNGAEVIKEVSNADTLFQEILSIVRDIKESNIKYVDNIVYPSDSLFAFSLVFSKFSIKYYDDTPLIQNAVNEERAPEYIIVKERKLHDEIFSIAFLRTNTNHLYISDKDNLSIVKIKHAKKIKNLVIDMLSGYSPDIHFIRKYFSLK